MSRRLPVYLLIDCSGSMMGDPIEAVRVGVDSLVGALMSDPAAYPSAYLSVITFSNKANQVVPLTPLDSFRMPDFKTEAGTMLGEALKELETRARQEVQKKSATQQGDWLPLVFILTDGKPSDTAAYKEMAERIRGGAIRELQPRNIVACAAGAQARPEELQKLTDNVLVLNTVTPEEITKYFAFVSMMTSSRVASVTPQEQSMMSAAKNWGLNAPAAAPTGETVNL